MFEHQKPAKLFTLSIKPRQLICYNCIKVNIIAIPVVYPPPRSYKANGVFKPDSWGFLHCWDIVKSLLIAKLVTQPTHPLVLEKYFFLTAEFVTVHSTSAYIIHAVTWHFREFCFVRFSNFFKRNVCWWQWNMGAYNKETIPSEQNISTESPDYSLQDEPFQVESKE